MVYGDSNDRRRSVVPGHTSLVEMNMNSARLLVISLAIAALAGAFMYVAQRLNLVSWVSFICWSGYFLAGGEPKEGGRMFVNWLFGVGMGAAIMILASAIEGIVTPEFSVPAAIFLVIVPVLMLENAPFLNMIPFMFFGAICLFALGKPVEFDTFKTLAIAGFFGTILGWVTVAMRVSITKFLARHDPLEGT